MSSLDTTLGAVLLGILVATLLFGITTLQAFNYYSLFTKDSVLLKSASYFASRIRVLSGRWHLAVICSVLSLLRFAFGIRITHVFWNSPSFSLLQGDIRWTFTTGVSLGPVVDIIIAISLCYFLWKLRSSQARFNRNNSDNEFLISGDHNLLWVPFSFIQPKLFANSMLASLNNRKGAWESEDKVISFESGSRGSRSRMPPQSNVAIHMHRLAEVDYGTESDYGITPAPKASASAL
ncbi:hypothetical protein B0H15DRAFT_934860 [Mycena belliarum]|uniref:DUF6534 domain-containing protein n=1 Tax=Mycena belliarum TaxID=1033014 RepID=A0AAD6TQI7_9AGAR|nr:hypothetical protein B0H15DRAFT_934860 [Mycena belliae]